MPDEATEPEDKAATANDSKPSAPTRSYRYVEEVDLRERVYLVGAGLKRDSNARSSSEAYSIEESLEELGRLADTAGLKVVGSTYQLLEAPNQRTYIGEGKVLSIAREVRALDVETVIFDDSLSPGQLRNLEKALETSEAGGVVRPCKVCDRTALILDIFAQRAQTREGKLQVELAQVEYQLPRLTRMWSHLDRVGGGGGGGGGAVKGMGETQIEIDKRLLRDRASALRKELESVRVHRRNYRQRRSETPVPVVALVGYTNAGKSTLLNTLTQAGVLAEDKLFATLDPTTRRVRLKGNKELLVSDTVGFIQKLPTELVAAFRATLEEIKDAAVLVHVVDISHPSAQAQSCAVEKVLKDLEIDKIPVIQAWNKVDLCPDPEAVRAVALDRTSSSSSSSSSTVSSSISSNDDKKRSVAPLSASLPPTVCISGMTGEGLEELLDLISHELSRKMKEMVVLLPYQQGDLLQQVHSSGEVLESEFIEEGVRVRARVPPSVAGRIKEYLIDKEVEEVVVEEEGSSDVIELMELEDDLAVISESR